MMFMKCLNYNRQILFTDNAVAGEGAALAIGLLMLGQSDSALAEVEIPNLLNAAHDSPHEKIVRALSLSIGASVAIVSWSLHTYCCFALQRCLCTGRRRVPT
jgi:hypothetical protein